MIAYRKKSRSDDVVNPENFYHGLVVWVGQRGTRTARYCGGWNGELLTYEEYLCWKRERAERNRATNCCNIRRHVSGVNERRSFAW